MGEFWELIFYPKSIYFVFNKCWFKITPSCHPSSVTRECLGPISGWVSMALVSETWMNKSLSTRSRPLLNWLRSLTDLRHVDSPQRQEKLSLPPPELYRFWIACVLPCRSFTQSSSEMTWLRLSRTPIQWTRTNWIPTRCRDIYVSYWVIVLRWCNSPHERTYLFRPTSR